MTEKDEVKDNIAMKIEELEEKVMNLSKTRNEAGTALNPGSNLLQSAAPHPRFYLVPAFLVLQMT